MKKDIAELQSLENVATRPKVKDIISIETRKLSSQLTKLEEQFKEQVDTTSSSLSTLSTNRYEINLKNYGK